MLSCDGLANDVLVVLFRTSDLLKRWDGMVGREGTGREVLCQRMDFERKKRSKK